MITTGLQIISLQSVAVGILLYITGLVVYRLYLHPLAKFPGPKLAAVTRWYEAYFDVIQNGQYTRKIWELHRQYGPIIRISPYELHINDADYYEKLFQQEGRWDKYAWTYDAFGVSNAAICTLDHYHHRKRRAPINPYFSKAAILGRQGLILRHLEKFQTRVKEYLGKPMELGAAISAMTADISTEMVLGQSINSLDLDDFNKRMTNMLQGAGSLWRITKHFRFYGPTLQAIPPSLLEKLGDPNVNAFLSYLRAVKARVQQLITEHKSGTVTKDTSENLIHAILDSSLPADEKALPRINDELDTVTGAAFETTAQTLRALVFYIYSDPKILSRLRSELREHLPPTVQQYSWAELERLPYLSAVVMEGLRLAPGIASRTARIAPDRELVYDGWTIPVGTPVGSTIILMHLDERNYTDPYKFNPDRWVDTGKKENTRAFAPFSKGSRMCLGMNLAWAELYLTTAMLVSTFDFDLGDTSAEDVQWYSDQFILGPKSKHGVKATPTLSEK